MIFNESTYQSPIAGVDEAGRGPLAGPVVACAVILPEDCHIEGVQDSKTLTEKRREYLSEKIKETALCYGIGIADVDTIDNINIHHATLLAMARAVELLTIQPKTVLVDGKFVPPNMPCNTVPIVRGDAISHVIAAASILAKVHRDGLMGELHNEYPQYGFDRHKGYPTKAHYGALDMHGPSIHHRQTFLRKWREG